MTIPCIFLAVVVAIVFVVVQPAISQIPDNIEISKSAKAAQKRGLFLLDRVRFELQSNYHDQTFGGTKLAERVRLVEEKIKRLNDQDAIYMAVAQLLLDLNDSHTWLEMPGRLYTPEYGFGTMIVGDKCYISYVKNDSDAAVQGLKAGDEVNSIGTVSPTRSNLRHINELLYNLKPQKLLNLRITGIDGQQRQVIFQAGVISRKDRIKEFEKQRNAERNQPYSCKELNTDLIVCKLRTFAVGDFALDGLLDAAAKKKRLILDLRGNGGGLVNTTFDFIGHFFDAEVLVWTERTKNGIRDRLAKARKTDAFKGELAVIIDSKSASAAEIFSRVIQIEQRGKIYGDVSAGSVMRGIFRVIPINEIPGRDGGSIYLAGLGITTADIVMKDGKRLEGVGVIPDVPIGPSGYAIRHGLDPVLSIVVEQLGGKLTPKEAGLLGFLVPKMEGIDANDNGDKP